MKFRVVVQVLLTTITFLNCAIITFNLALYLHH